MWELSHNRIILTSTTGEIYELKTYESISIDYSFTSKVNRFNLSTTVFDESKLKKYGVGAEIKIYHAPSSVDLYNVVNLEDYIIFKGVITQNPKTLAGITKKYQLSGYSSVYQLQTILVNESYVEKPVNELIRELVEKYASDYCTVGYIENITFPLTIKFKDSYLYTALEKIASASNCSFDISFDDVFSFQNINNKVNNKPILIDEYEKGSAQFQYSESQLVNRLKIYGGINLSPDITQYLSPTADGNSLFMLNHKPRASSSGEIQIYLDNVKMNIMPEELHQEGDGANVLLDYNNQTIKFITTTSEVITNPDGTTETRYTDSERIIPRTSVIKAVYRREDKLVVQLEDKNSQVVYGIKDGYITFSDITDKNALIEQGQNHLNKYSTPILSGSVNTWLNDHHAGETVKVEIQTEEGYFVNDWILMTGKTTSLVPNMLKNSYKFEQQPALIDAMKGILERLESLEKDTGGNDTVQQLDYMPENLKIIALIQMFDAGRFRIGAGIIGKTTLGGTN